MSSKKRTSSEGNVNKNALDDLHINTSYLAKLITNTSYLAKLPTNTSYPANLIINYLAKPKQTNSIKTYIIKTYFYLPLPDMDTSSGNAKQGIRVSLTEQYEARVASTLEKVDPNRAKARATLKEDEMEVEALDGEWSGYTEPMPSTSQSYTDAPVLTLRERVPGSTGCDDEDKELDQSFRSDKIDFIVVQRDLKPDEVTADGVLMGPADVDWSIPDRWNTRTSWV